MSTAQFIGKMVFEENRLKAETGKIRVLVGDEHPLPRLELMGLLEDQPDMTVVGEASNGRMALKLCAEELPDVALLDMHMPGLFEIDAIKLLRAKLTPVRVIVLASTIVEDDVVRALQSGAHGFLPKTVNKGDLLDAIRTVHRGEKLDWQAISG